MNNPKLRFRDDSGSRFVDWQKVSFGKTFSFLKSSAFSRAQLNYRGGQIKNVHYGDILVKFPTILNSCCNDVPYVNPAEKTEKYDLLQVGDIVIADTAEDLTVGKAIEISDVSNNIIAGLHTIACRPQRKFANRFLGYYLNSKAFHNQLVPLATGIKVYSIIKSEIVKTRINVPCLEEQQKIASFFSTLDEKIELSERKLEALKQLKKGLMQKIFDQKLRFKAKNGESFSAWELRRIADVATVFAGGTPSTKIREYWEAGTIPWMSSGEVHNRRIFFVEKKISELGYKNSSAKMVKKGSVVIALAGQGKTRGTVAITATELCTNQSLAAIEPYQQVNSEFLYQYLKTQYQNLRSLSDGGSGRGGLNLKLISDFKIPVPDIQEQNHIGNFLAVFDERIAIVERLIDTLKQLKKGFMQQMFV